MFVKFHGITQHMGESAGKAMLEIGAVEATAMEAAECISRLVVNGNNAMHEANEDFKRIYMPRVSAAEVVMAVPNQAADGKRVSKLMREDRENTGTFDHLFGKDGKVL